MGLIAYHGDHSVKDAAVAHIREHAEADRLIKGRYWENGKGCAVGCQIHSANHVEYESRFGIPQMLARLEDCIFEGLPNVQAQAWPERFMGAIRPGADLSRVGWQFLHWLLTDNTINPGIDHPLVRGAVRQCADVLVPLAKDKPVNASAARSAAGAAESAARSAAGAAESAESAARSAWSAESAAWSAAWSAESAAESAESARSAESAAWSARSAAESAWSARSAAESAWSARSARSAESAARSAWSAESAAYVLMSDKIIALIEAA